MPWMIVSSEDGSEHCVHKQNADKSAGEKLKCYKSKDEASNYMKALYANVEHQVGNFVFVEMSEALTESGKPIDGLAAGTYTAMNGRRVHFKEDDLPEYVARTREIIESTKDSSGVPVGLPIDLDKHDHAGGAGWIVGIDYDKANRLIKLGVNWLDAGKEVIKKNIRRFFSPSINPENKTIVGGSLTNWPASRSAEGKMMLRPVELSEQLQEIDMEAFIETLSQLPKRVALAVKEGESGKTDEKDDHLNEGEQEMGDTTTKNPKMAELLNSPAAVQEIARRSTEQAELTLKTERRRTQVAEFASQLVGGTVEKPYGLPVPVGDVVEFVLAVDALDSRLADAAMMLLTTARKAAIDFAEHGTNIGGDGSFIGKPKLPTWLKPYYETWLKSGKSPKDFFEANAAELAGQTEKDFNLAEFADVKPAGKES